MFRYVLPKDAGGFEIVGRSRAADATCITIPSLCWALDCGAIVQNWRPEVVFITHTHSDHANRVTHVVSRRKPPTIYLPSFAAPLLEGYIDAHQAMTDNRTLAQLQEAMKRGPPDWQINRKSQPVEVGDIIELKKGGRDWSIEVIACEHSVPCVGYAFREKKRSLKKEYQGLPGKELGALRKAGTEINEEVLINRFVFMGDTEASVFSSNPGLLEFPVIITECSFFTEEHLETAKRTKHTHWNDLQKFITDNPNTLFVLIHFSMRYSNQEIVAFFENLQTIKNVVPFVDPDDNSAIWID
mmetsp:Transcript_19637/g.33435  ORF Transcript_19637/g.33435 Transcript_19637/m.33435 type:complete len:299 (-) Transcript_19637:57-953(-)